jgi:hypothetical protein
MSYHRSGTSAKWEDVNVSVYSLSGFAAAPVR